MKRLFLIIAFISAALGMSAQKIANVCGEIDYMVPETQTLVEAKQTALSRARLQAIAEKFGTNVSQTTTTAMHSQNGQTDTRFNTYSENEVRGLWLNDTQEPVVDVRYQNGNMVIHVEVCGKAREQKNAEVEMMVKPLNRDFESANFKNNDRFSVSFKSAASGYVAVFLRDDDNEMVYVMLPYENSDGNAREVKSNREYTFLSTRDPEYPYQEETILTTSKTMEYNTLIVVFSQRQFHISLSNMGEFVPEVENTKFQKWLHSLRVYDTTAQVEQITLTIKK